MSQKSQCISCRNHIESIVFDFCKIKETGIVYDKLLCSEYKKSEIDLTVPKKGIFQCPFSFSGRIGRMEYFVSIIIFNIIGFMINEIRDFNLGFGFLEFSILVLWFWFFLSQSVKRSHDVGNSGLWVIFPPYGLWLLFERGNEGSNSFGE